ncbi:hypothetical protein [Azospirillum largimobile]
MATPLSLMHRRAAENEGIAFAAQLFDTAQFPIPCLRRSTGFLAHRRQKRLQKAELRAIRMAGMIEPCLSIPSILDRTVSFSAASVPWQCWLVLLARGLLTLR